MLGRLTMSWITIACFVAVLVCVLLYEAPRAEAASSCSGKRVYPSQNLTRVAAGSPAGTTFCLRDGNYEISGAVYVQDRDRFIGVYRDRSRPAVVTNRARQVFEATSSDGATIRGLRISGAVGGNYCEPYCGRGIQGGTDLTVDNVRATDNANQGIGGTGPRLLVRGSVVDRNGSYSFARDGGIITAAGIKSADSMTILNSQLRNNYWDGVWCDNQCGAFTVKNSTIIGNGKAGIHDEISTGPATIAGNTIRGNGVLSGADRHAGLLIVDSTNVNAYNNSFGRNVLYGVHVIDYGRSPRTSGVRLRDNTMNGNRIAGCSLPGVYCARN